MWQRRHDFELWASWLSLVVSSIPAAVCSVDLGLGSKQITLPRLPCQLSGRRLEKKRKGKTYRSASGSICGSTEGSSHRWRHDSVGERPLGVAAVQQCWVVPGQQPDRQYSASSSTWAPSANQAPTRGSSTLLNSRWPFGFAILSVPL